MTSPQDQTQAAIRSFATPMEDVAGRALSALLADRGGCIRLGPAQITAAPDRVAIAIDVDGSWILTGVHSTKPTTDALIRFDTLKTARLVRWTAEVFGDEFVLTGHMAPYTLLWPPVGDDVHIRRLELPGRGVLEDITARVTISNHRQDIVLTVGFPVPTGFLDAS